MDTRTEAFIETIRLAEALITKTATTVFLRQQAGSHGLEAEIGEITRLREQLERNKALLEARAQIPREQLIEDRWYLGRGRNGNVAKWTRLGKTPAAPASWSDRRDGRLTFLTLGSTFHEPVVKDEGYYRLDMEDGCFQPFLMIDEGVVAEPMGTGPGWDQHYAKKLSV